VSMGGVAIWCMHFIANCAIVLGNREPALQIVYNKTFTAISFFVPIVVLLAAFMLIGANENVRLVRLVPGGALTGLAICGMHYLGQAGIANYTSVYDIGRVVLIPDSHSSQNDASSMSSFREQRSRYPSTPSISNL
jgi:NO-binding membrane sensor protein with MHYT domain